MEGMRDSDEDIELIDNEDSFDTEVKFRLEEISDEVLGIVNKKPIGIVRYNIGGKILEAEVYIVGCEKKSKNIFEIKIQVKSEYMRFSYNVSNNTVSQTAKKKRTKSGRKIGADIWKKEDFTETLTTFLKDRLPKFV